MNADPREGVTQQAFAQVRMFDDAESVRRAPATSYPRHHGEGHGDSGGNRQVKHLNEVQSAIVSELTRVGESGLIVSELRSLTGKHHGMVSGALTVLHKAGIVARLQQKRNRSSVYVMSSEVGARSVIAPKNDVTSHVLAHRLKSCVEESEADGTPIVIYEGYEYHLAADLLEALMEGFDA